MLSSRKSPMPSGGWRKSTYSGQDGDCIEVAGTGAAVLVRDTKRRDGPVLAVSAAAWRAFAEGLKG